MDFEKNNKKENATLYPERAFSAIYYDIDRLKKLEKGEIEVLELNEAEREELFEFEKGLGEELEFIDGIKVNSITFYPEYFLTREGVEEFQKATGFVIEGNTVEDVSLFIYKKRKNLDLIDGKVLSDLAGKSLTYTNDSLLEKIKSSSRDGNFDVSKMSNPKRIGVVLNPENVWDKIRYLRQFKRNKIKGETSGEEEIGDLRKAKEKILQLYRRRVNEMIVAQFNSCVLVKNAADLLNEEELSLEEFNLIKSWVGLNDFAKAYSKYDKVLFGADLQYDEEGQRRQIGEKIKKYADEIEEKYIDNELNKNEKLKGKGLDSEKVFNKDIPKEIFVEWEEEFLERYGEKSSFPSNEYDPKRKGAALDGKWQFVVSERYKSMAVDSKQNIIKAGVLDKSIYDIVAILLTHENTHFVQAVNQKLLKLRLFNKVGSDRRQVFSEGGAMMMQDKICRELFGFESIPHPHYIRAMETKLNGGSYIDCVKAFYESNLKVIRMKKERGLIDEEVFSKEVENAMKLAIDRTKRLFHSGDTFEDNGNVLTHSKDTVYLEQLFVMEKMRENGLEKYALIRGANLKTIIELAEIGLLDISEIKELIPFAREIWEREKHKYLLDKNDQEQSDEQKLEEVREAIQTLDSSVTTDKS